MYESENWQSRLRVGIVRESNVERQTLSVALLKLRRGQSVLDEAVLPAAAVGGTDGNRPGA